MTPRGLDLRKRIVGALGRGAVVPTDGAVRDKLTELFRKGQPLVCIMALGIVVRILGPMTRDKTIEPAVVVVDEAGQLAISVLGGHQAGGNDLARLVAAAIGATPVITTASEALGLPAIDLIGQSRGWRIESTQHLTEVSAAVVRGEKIAVLQDVGRPWYTEFGHCLDNFQLIRKMPHGPWAGVLLISDHTWPAFPYPTVIYRPPSLVVGVGCRRGVQCAEIEALFEQVFQEQRLSPLSVGLVATASLKADEPGLLEFAQRHGVPLRCFEVKELASVSPPTPSETVRAKIGVLGVAEPAALLAAGEDGVLIVPKQRGQRVTLAVARRVDA